MANNVFSKIMSKAVSAVKNEGTTANVKIHFKNFRRKKFIKNAKKDIKVYYKSTAYEATLAELAEDVEKLNSPVLTVSAAEQASRRFSNAPDATAKAAAETLHLWEIYQDIKCQVAAIDSFPDVVIADEETMNKITIIKDKVRNILVKTKAKLTAKGLLPYYQEKVKEVESAVYDYQALIDVLK